MKTVYLAGPIKDCTKSQANDWRRETADALASFGLVGISPLRCEPLIGPRYTANYSDPKFGLPHAIKAKNSYDVRSCDITLAYLPKLMDGVPHQSYGTIIELAWAHAYGKLVVLVTTDPEVREHPVINASSDWVLDDLEEAIEVCAGILGGYTSRGKNV